MYPLFSADNQLAPGPTYLRRPGLILLQASPLYLCLELPVLGIYAGAGSIEEPAAFQQANNVKASALGSARTSTQALTVISAFAHL